MPADTPFLTLKEAAQLLRYSTSSLYKRRDIPRRKLPGSKDWRYDREELLVWAKSAPPSVQAHFEPKNEPSSVVSVDDTSRTAVRRRVNSRYCAS